MTNPKFSRLQGEPLRGLTDLPDDGASTSSAGMFARQDSLALLSQLQERDRQYHNVDFMEAELDLDNYLQCFTELDVPADNIDLNDAELQKANILYDGDGPFEPAMLNGYERHVTYGPAYQQPNQYATEPYQMNCEVKPEMDTSIKSRRPIKRRTYEDYQEYTGNSSDSSENESLDDSYLEPEQKKKRSSLADFKPQTRARKYHTKAAEEKAEPTYKLKRARNNDAVRKCRNRAQELKKQKDEEYDQMKARIVELEQLVETERQGRLRSEKLLEELIKQQKPPMPNVKQESNDRFVPGTSSRYSKRH